MINFGNNLRFLRKKMGLKQSEVLEYKQSTWGGYESGASFPKFEDLIKISEYFGIDEYSLIHSDLADVSNTKILDFKKNKENVSNDVSNDVSNKSVKWEYEGANAMVNEPLERYNTNRMPTVVTVDESGNDNIVHVPVKARAGYLLGYGDVSYMQSLPAYKIPGLRNGTYRSFEVEGTSMRPTFMPHDWVIGEWVESLSDIRENRCHVIVTKNDGILIKRVLNRIETRGKLYLKSDTVTQRFEYPTIEIEPENIAEIWYVRMRLSTDFSEPSEIYTRLSNTEIDIIELKKEMSALRQLKIQP